MNDRLRTDGLTALKIDRSPRPKASRRSMATLVWLAAAVILLLVAGGWWVLQPVPVRTSAVVVTDLSRQLVQLTAAGRVVAQVRAAVASKATGRVVEMLVQEGSLVERGGLIARIDAADADAALQAVRAGVQQARARLRQAEVELARAKADHKRTAELQGIGFVSAQAQDQARGRADAAKAAVEAAVAAVRVSEAEVQVQSVNRAQAEIRAPFDGMVVVRHAQVGDILSPLSVAAGARGAVVTMADLKTLEVEADVSEAQLSKVGVGAAVEVAFDALAGERFRGRVATILPTVDAARATITVRLRLDQLDPRILPEMSAKVNFMSRPTTEADQKPLLMIPAAAVVKRDDRLAVFRLREDAGEYRVQLVTVQLGHPSGESIELRPGSSIQAGDRLVLEPGRWLRDGSAVRPGAS
jgi:HlyD family secretion protein